MATIQEIRELSAFQLASDADCFTPDSLESEGAKYLTAVRNAVAEAWESGRFESKDDDSDVIREIADESLTVYTHPRWVAFVDLGAYQEENELGAIDPMDMAVYALTEIGCRLATALLESLREGSADETDDDETDDDE